MFGYNAIAISNGRLPNKASNKEELSGFWGLGEEFGEVFGVGGGVLGDLFGAAEAVGEDGGLGVVADGGEEDSVGEGLGDFVFVFFEAEGAGHAAAA